MSDVAATLADMADNSNDWVTLPQATGLLGISDRTLHRRIAAGRYQTRLKDGRRFVRVRPAAVAELSATSATSATSDISSDKLGLSVSQNGSHASAMADTTPDSASATLAEMAATTAQAVQALQELLEAERHRADEERRRAGDAEQAAAMWQERARGLEAETQRLQARLALPAPQPALHAPWWAFWRQGREIAH